jgi:CHAD domain-containing protein
LAKAKSIPSVDPEAAITAHAAVSVGTRLDELAAYDFAIWDPKFVTELHEMRIAAKRLRYTMDIFAPAFQQYTSLYPRYASAVNEVKKLQTFLGVIHDADVLVPQLLRELDTALESVRTKPRKKSATEPVGVHLVDLDACSGILTVCTEARNRRDEAFTQLQQEWGRLQEQGYADEVRKLLRAGITEQTVAIALHEDSE